MAGWQKSAREDRRQRRQHHAHSAALAPAEITHARAVGLGTLSTHSTARRMPQGVVVEIGRAVGVACVTMVLIGTAQFYAGHIIRVAPVLLVIFPALGGGVRPRLEVVNVYDQRDDTVVIGPRLRRMCARSGPRHRNAHREWSTRAIRRNAQKPMHPLAVEGRETHTRNLGSGRAGRREARDTRIQRNLPIQPRDLTAPVGVEVRRRPARSQTDAARIEGDAVHDGLHQLLAIQRGAAAQKARMV